MLNSVLRQLYKYDETKLTEHYNQRNQEWRNWCDDVLLYYCFNYVLFDNQLITI
jgi:hypothetical protein